jgi:serine/threonine protein kinase
MAKSKLYGQRWKVVDPKILGQGGQGRVFKVVDTTGHHQGEWALKVVFNRRRHERFRNEVEAVKALSNRNIIRLVDHSAFAEDASSTADG